MKTGMYRSEHRRFSDFESLYASALNWQFISETKKLKSLLKPAE